MTLRKQLDQYVDAKTPEVLALLLDCSPQAIKNWRKNGKYSMELVEKVLAEEAARVTLDASGEPTGPVDSPLSAPRPFPEDAILGDLDMGLVSALNEIDQLKARILAIEQRFSPPAPPPAAPTTVVLPKQPMLESVADTLVEASTVRPGPLTPTPHIVSGPEPPAIQAPLPQPKLAKHWSQPFDDDYRSRRLRR